METEDKKDGLRWDICVDGSDISWDAFHTVFDNLRKPNDFTIVSNVFSDADLHKSMKFKPSNIKQDCEAKLIGTHSSKWDLQFQNTEPNSTKMDTALQLASDTKSDILVLGYHGIKGAKGEPTLLEADIDTLAKKPGCPILIIKNVESRKNKENGAFRFLVCMDGRSKSFDALKTIINLMDKEKDELVISTVAKTGVDHDKIKKLTDSACESLGVKNHRFETLSKSLYENHHQAIIDYINVEDTPYIDFVAIANRGAVSHSLGEYEYLGKVAKQVVLKSKANILLIP